MMQKLWLQKLKLNYNKKDVVDIIQFGSSVEDGKVPRDLDIAVIFNKIPIKEQLNQAQKIKEQLEKLTKIPIHINSFDLYNLFDNANFARDSILFYGKSVIWADDFSKRFGFSPKIQIYYSLKKLKKKDKIRFNYMLNGRSGEYGLLRKYGGELLKPGLIEVTPEFKNIFINSIKEFEVDFRIKKILIN